MKNDVIDNGKQISIDEELVFLAEILCIKSASLAGTHSGQILYEIKELNRKVNSYYSISINHEGAHPALMDRYAKEGFSANSKEAQLQLHSINYIDQQKILEKYFSDSSSVADFNNKLINDLCNKLFGSSEDESEGKWFEVGLKNHTTEAKKLIGALKIHLLITELYEKSNEYRMIARLVLDGLLSAIEGYGLWNISRGLYMHSMEYEKYLNVNGVESGYITGQSTENFKSYIKFMLEVGLEQVNYAKENLNITKMYKNIQNYVHLSKEGLFDQDPLPEDSELLFKELLLSGEIPRGDVAMAINKKSRAATYLNKRLIDMDLITSDTPKGPIRIKFNMHFASYLFPCLIR